MYQSSTICSASVTGQGGKTGAPFFKTAFPRRCRGRSSRRPLPHHIRVFQGVFSLCPENHCAVSHDPFSSDTHSLSFELQHFPSRVVKRGWGVRTAAMDRARMLSPINQRSDPPSHHCWRRAALPVQQRWRSSTASGRCSLATTTRYPRCAPPWWFSDSCALWPTTRCPPPPHQRAWIILFVCRLCTLHASPALESSPLSNQCATASSDRTCPPHRDLPLPRTLISLWTSPLPKLAAFQETVHKASTFSQLPQAQTESQTLFSSDNVEISRQAAKAEARKTSHHNTVSWAHEPCGCCLSSHLVRSLFHKTYTVLVWAMHCAVLLVALRTTATNIVFFFATTIVSSSFSDSPNSVS